MWHVYDFYSVMYGNAALALFRGAHVDHVAEFYHHKLMALIHAGMSEILPRR
jgi:hypothetical protein